MKLSYFRLEVSQSSPMVEQINGSSKYLSGSYTTIPIRGPSYELGLGNGIHCDSSIFVKVCHAEICCASLGSPAGKTPEREHARRLFHWNTCI